MHKRIVLKRILKFTLKQLLHVSVQSPSSGSALFELFHSRTVHLDIIKGFYLPTDAQEKCFKKNIKIYIKTASTCFGAITIIREHI